MTTADFIREHLRDDVRTLAFQKERYPDIDFPYALDQIEGYQLVPPSRSYSPTTKETPQIAQTVREVADAAISAADDLVEGLGGMIAPTAHGEDYAETVWQRKLRNQANRKKKRGRGL